VGFATMWGAGRLIGGGAVGLFRASKVFSWRNPPTRSGPHPLTMLYAPQGRDADARLLCKLLAGEVPLLTHGLDFSSSITARTMIDAYLVAERSNARYEFR
jgi:hypothetical protein